MLLEFDDAVTAGNLPAHQHWGVFYADGEFANEKAVRARLGDRAVLASITTRGQVGPAFAFIDCEKWDATVAQAEAWVRAQIARGVRLIGVYASLSTWAAGLWAALEKYGDRIKRWCAAYDQAPSLRLTYNGHTYLFDAHQWAGNVPPGVDRNVAKVTFFDPWEPSRVKRAVRHARHVIILPVWKLEQLKDRIWRRGL